MKILVVEDSAPTRDLLRRSLSDAGHAVQFASRIGSARKYLDGETFDVVVLDVMLPDGDGLALCAEVRAAGHRVPILFLTARGEVGDRIAGLDAGGDDYLKKPFALAELHARLRALARRQGLAPPRVLTAGTVRLDFTARTFHRAGAELPLTAREWDVLEFLAARVGRVVARDDVLDAIWHEAGPNASDSLDVIAGRLRRKLGDERPGCILRTVRGQGYRLEVTA